MWNLGPGIVSACISALGPPLMTLEYQEDLPRDTVPFPPA
jgi:hypothetical protein